MSKSKQPTAGHPDGEGCSTHESGNDSSHVAGGRVSYGNDALEEFKSRYGSHVSGFLSQCEDFLTAISGRPGRTLGKACTFTLAAGGKRLRPLLVYLSARRGYASGEAQLVAAVAVEMVHMATLVHDDVLDDAQLRRGQPTVFSQYGSSVSNSAGDYLFSGAFDVLADTGSVEAVGMLARTSLDLSRGELLQMESAGDLDLDTDAYEARCRLKTSSLFSTACRLGAHLSGCDETTVETIGRYGDSIGLAFQIYDDILDFSGDQDMTGKGPGADLRDGTITLPLILAMQSDSSLREQLRDGLVEEQLGEICAAVRKSGAIEAAMGQAHDHVGRANDALKSVAADLDTGPLELIAAATVDRKA